MPPLITTGALPFWENTINPSAVVARLAERTNQVIIAYSEIFGRKKKTNHMALRVQPLDPRIISAKEL
jgi:hypothetical protein